MSAPTGSFIAFATAPGSVAADGTGRNGTFTKHLLASLQQPDLDIDRVFTRVTAAVAQETGLYYDRCQPRTPSALAQDTALARELWQRSEQWVQPGG